MHVTSSERQLDETLRRLRRPSLLRSGVGLAGDWILIVATLYVAWRIDRLATYVLCAYCMGIYQQRLGVMGHEAVHHLLSRSRRVNDFVGNVFCFWPLGTSVLGYRRFHFLHHKFTNVSSDPEWRHTKTGPWDTPTTPGRMVLYSIRDLAGLSVRDTIATIRLTHPPTVRSFCGPIILAAGFIGFSVATGNLWLPLVWYGGLYTSSWAVLRWRIWFEHIGAANTHRVHFPLLARWIISPHNIWVHWEHHKHSSIPYWNLPAVRSLDKSEPLLGFSELLNGFLRDWKLP